MLKLYRASLSGARANLTALDVIANNIANVQTPGFRATRVEFADLLYEQLAPQDIGLPPDDASVLPRVGTGVGLVATTPSERTGPRVSTGRPLDIAIEGEGYFAITLASGETGYTRAGVFSIGSDRSMLTSDGFRVQPRIDIPEGVTQLRVEADGDVVSRSDAGVFETHGRLQLTVFGNPAGLESIGSSLFRATQASGTGTLLDPGEQGAGTLQGATLELSNTDLAEQFASIITVQRAFQMNLAALRQADEMLGLVTQLGR